MKATVKIKGMSKLYFKIAAFRKEFEQAEKRAVTAGGKILQSRIAEEMMHTDPYSGTPYGKGSNPRGINLSAISPLKAYAIRSKSGNLLLALSGKLDRMRFRDKKGRFVTSSALDRGWEYIVGMDKSAPTYTKYVFQGTKVMWARDPITAMHNDKATQTDILRVITKELGF